MAEGVGCGCVCMGGWEGGEEKDGDRSGRQTRTSECSRERGVTSTDSAGAAVRSNGWEWETVTARGEAAKGSVGAGGKIGGRGLKGERE